MKRLNLLFFTSLFLILTLGSGCKRRNGTDFSFEKNQTPQKIVSLSPASTEILFAIGAGSQVAAVSEYTDFPEEAKKLPKAGGFDGKTISFEKILSFEPDLVYLTQGMHEFLIPKLEEFKINYIVSKGDSVQGVESEIIEAGKLTGHEEESLKTAEKIEKDFETARKMTSENIEKPMIYWEVWNSPFMSAGKGSFINDMIEKSGGTNIFSDIEQAYPEVSEEIIVSRNPDVILIPASSGITVESVKNRIGWKDISAVKCGKIFIVDDNIWTRPGPRIGECAIQLCKMISGRYEK